jgi:rubrerythrin
MGKVTVGQAFDVAIGAERAAEKLFQGLEAKFAHHKDLAAFWARYAFDETKHAEWLEGLRTRLTPDKLAGSVDAEALALLTAVTGFSVEKALAGVKDMEDAYQLVNEIENGETNAIFQFLMNNFETNQETRDFLRAQLRKHITKLSDEMPIAYRGALSRRGVKASM